MPTLRRNRSPEPDDDGGDVAAVAGEKAPHSYRSKGRVLTVQDALCLVVEQGLTPDMALRACNNPEVTNFILSRALLGEILETAKEVANEARVRARKAAREVARESGDNGGGGASEGVGENAGGGGGSRKRRRIDAGASASAAAAVEQMSPSHSFSAPYLKGKPTHFEREVRSKAKQLLENESAVEEPADGLANLQGTKEAYARSRTVTWGAAATSSLSSGLESFSKASFCASTGEGDGKDVDLDDPDFWSKAVGLEAPPEEQDETMALIIGDGSKRARKQVEAFDFGAEAEAEAERKRLEMIARKKQEELERKKLERLEKSLRRQAEREAREKKKQEAIELKKKLKEKKLKAMKEQKDLKAEELKKKLKEVKIVYNDKKTDRKRALKRAEHEDPVFERVKQAWDTSQRSRVINAILRFGFGRFCKVRHESNFTSLPIQDVEVFARSYIYQLGLQAASTLLSDVDCGDVALDEDVNNLVQQSLRKMLGPLIRERADFEWICNAILTSLCMHMRVKEHDAFVRMPLTLAEPAFLHDLRQGVAIRSLHRISFLSRFNGIMEEVIDRTISDIGREQMGQRGCLTKDYSTLDMDLKARYIRPDELMHSLSVKLNAASTLNHVCPPWWDRSCDLGLVMGTFFHGLGNYGPMRNDEDLPFGRKIQSYIRSSSTEAESYYRFEVAAEAAKQVFDTALEIMKRKFQEQTHAAVAAVFAQQNKSGENTKPAYILKTQEMDDDDIVSLTRLKDAVLEAFRQIDLSTKAGTSSLSLPLPDSKYLDCLLVEIINNMESQRNDSFNGIDPKGFDSSSTDQPQEKSTKAKTIATNKDTLQNARLSQKTTGGTGKVIFAGSLSGADKKPQDYGSDYFLGAASQDLASIAVGADSSRYQRGPFVPLILTRFALGAILQSEESVIERLANEKDLTGNGSDKDCPEPQKTNNSPTANSHEKEPCSDASAPKSGEAADDEKPPAELSTNTGPPWQFIKDEPTLRASLCTVLLFGGYPSAVDCHESFSNISAELYEEIRTNSLLLTVASSRISSPMTICPFYSMEDAFCPALNSADVDWSENKGSLKTYFQEVLLPHCLKLCLTLAAEQTKFASEQGKANLYLGRPGLNKLTPLPDPFIPLEDHSEEAMANAYAILRRIRLMKSIRFIVGGGVPLKVLTDFLHGPVWRSQGHGCPIWWCPWVHDLGLLVNAALYGLGSIANVPPAQESLISQHVRETFINGTTEREPALPKCLLDQLSTAEIDAWVEMHSKQYPTFHVIEHRLALICSHLTEGTDAQYDYVPMFDEGGWPKIEDVTTPGFLADTKAGRRCLLSDYERLSG